MAPRTNLSGTHGVSDLRERRVATPPREAGRWVGAEGAAHQLKRRALRHRRLGAEDPDALGRHWEQKEFNFFIFYY